MTRIVFFADGRETKEILDGQIQRIVSMMGITTEAFHRHFDFIHFGSKWDHSEDFPDYQKIQVMNIRPLFRGKKIVLLGRFVAESFEIAREKYHYCEWIDHPKWEDHHGLFTVIPNPSLGNVMYANAEMFEMVRRHLDYMWQMRDSKE